MTFYSESGYNKDIEANKQRGNIMQSVTVYDVVLKQAITKHSLGAAKERHGERIGERILTMTTSKSYSMLRTSISVSLHVDNTMQHIFSFKGDKQGDFSSVVQEVGCNRASEKAITKAHINALAFLPAAIKEAEAHYQE